MSEKKEAARPLTPDELALREKEELCAFSMALARMTRDERLMLSGFASGIANVGILQGAAAPRPA